MAGIRGKSGPPGNQNAFRHGLAGIAQRRADGVLKPAEQSIREEILSGLLTDKGGAAQALAQLDVYKRPLVSSLSGNLQRVAMEKVTKKESLQELSRRDDKRSETNEKDGLDCCHGIGHGHLCSWH
jgi:hypothetical protein